jgi:Barstar (barnase inhibitor)
VVGSFDNSPETWQRRDWELLQNGLVTLFCSKRIFDADIAELADIGYHVVELDAGEWGTTEAALLAIGMAFDFPDYYGRNMNALVDCLRDVATFDYGSDPASTGTVVAIDRLEALARRDPDLVWSLLNILADTGRQALLIGHRFIVMARSDDPMLSVKPVGASPVMWNRREWLDRDRKAD